jgi:hypothetical protein
MHVIVMKRYLTACTSASPLQGQKYYNVEFKYDLLTGAGFIVERVGWGSYTQVTAATLALNFKTSSSKCVHV